MTTSGTGDNNNNNNNDENTTTMGGDNKAAVKTDPVTSNSDSKTNMSAGASAGVAAAAAAAAAASATTDNDSIPARVSSSSSGGDPNSIQSILANSMPKHLLDRSTDGSGAAAAAASMSLGLSGQGNGADGADGTPVGAVAAAAAANQHHPVAEFLYQLTKMLTDDNSEIIEWTDGRIKVHYPERLEDEVLHKYFRHSKFASFQRQLNYFGFRKIAGKGKMSPCSYVNEAATGDIRSLLLIKRKTNGSAARKAMAQRAAALQLTNGLGGVNGMAGVNGVPGMVNPALGTGLPGLAGLSLQLQMQKQLGVNLNPGAGFQPNGGNAFGLESFSGGAPVGAPGAPPGGNGSSANQLSQLLLQNQGMGMVGRHSFADLQQLGSSVGGPASAAAAPASQNQPPALSAMATLEQLQAQLAELQNQASANGSSSDGAASAALNAAALNLAQASSGLSQQFAGASAAANSLGGGGENPATAALNASAALDNPSQQAQITNMNSLFESATNLKALIGNESGDTKTAASALAGLPSTGGFQSSISNVSLGNLLSSNARLSSLLSLNSFLSREPSLADLAMMQPSARNNTVNQYAAFQQHATQQQQQMNLSGGAPASGAPPS
mmetsp:Transcript_37244/g.90388  ORF Transcript_37244/g.90388 Transcript_37244/m.90388 type:complete len:611 (+) Transcript_37244:435-2267(+)